MFIMRTFLVPIVLLLLAAPLFAGASPSSPVTSFGSLEGNRLPVGTNNFGQVVAYTDTGGSSSPHAFRDVSGSSTQGKARGRNTNSAFTLDYAGRVAAYGGTPGSHACLYADSLMIDFEALGGTSNAAYGIGEAGQVAGHKARSGKSGADEDSIGNGSMGKPGIYAGIDNFGAGYNSGSGGNFGAGGSPGTGVNNVGQAGPDGDAGRRPTSPAAPFASGRGSVGGDTDGARGSNGGQAAGAGGNGGSGNGGNGNGGNGGTPSSQDYLADGGPARDFNAMLHPLSGFTSEGTGGTDGSGQTAGLDCIGRCDAALPTRSDPVSVPEPGSLALFTLALATSAALRWTGKRKAVKSISRGHQVAR
jgi:hypothetical protein